MSYAIENLKFTIFGHGHDVVRNDSGNGTKSQELNLKVYSAVIDSSGQYVWFVTDGGLKKYSTRTWEEVEQNTIPSTSVFVAHPSNVENNYGIAFNGGDTAYVFDLTDDTLVCTVSVNFLSAIETGTYDCILVGDVIYLAKTNHGNANIELISIDLENEVGSKTTIASDRGFGGFINNSSLYAVYERVWFSQTTTAYSLSLGGGTIWSTGDTDNNSNMRYWGLTTNGMMYFPVYYDGKWCFGEFNGTSQPTFKPITPLRVFGDFENCPSLSPYLDINDRRHPVTYTDGREKACMFTTEGILITDFNSVEVLSEDQATPIAMNDRMVICSDYYNNKVFIYGI